MANINSVITYNANLSPAQAQIKALTGQIGALSAAFNTLDKSALSAQRSLAATFAANAGQIGGFTAQTVKANNAVETFGKQLAANRLTMREYFREAFTGYAKQNTMLRRLAEQQVRYQQSVAVPTGPGQAMIMTPQSINAASSAAQLASQRFSIFNQLVNGGATAMLNWGKNTQWAGRQLMVGFTVPLMLFTAVASKQFRELDKELTRFQKVYGSDLGGAISESTKRMREDVQELAYEISRTYGIAAKETAALAADIAATGAEGEQLMASIQQTTRLAVLGEVDRQEAMKATLSLQSAFRMNTNELAESINFLNAVENQTSATLEDLATAIPKVGPVVRSLGGDIKDLATLLVAMREGGIPAAEAANALKSGLASLINPTKQASEVAKQFGVDLVGIVNANRGQLMPTIYAMQDALNGLDSFSRSKIIEQIFGKYQFARITALFDNIGRTGSQTQQVVELAAKSSAELAAVANGEIRTLTESTAVKFQRTLEELKNAIMPIGQTLTETLIPIFEFIGKGMKAFTSFFQALPEPVKNFAKYGVAIAALAGPVIMLVGLFGNLIANGIKFGMMVTRLGARIAGIKTEKFELLNADVMAAKLGVDNLTTSFNNQETSMKRLVGVMSAYEASLRRLSISNPALFIPGAVPGPRGVVPIRRQTGSTSPEKVPGGYGGGDKIPALLEPGEMVVRKEAVAQYAPIISAMNRGNLPGYENGKEADTRHRQRALKSDVFVLRGLGANISSPGGLAGIMSISAKNIADVTSLYVKEIASAAGTSVSAINREVSAWRTSNAPLLKKFNQDLARAIQTGNLPEQQRLIKEINDKFITDMRAAGGPVAQFAVKAKIMFPELAEDLIQTQAIIEKTKLNLNSAEDASEFYSRNMGQTALLSRMGQPGNYRGAATAAAGVLPMLPGTNARQYMSTYGIPAQFLDPRVRGTGGEASSYGIRSQAGRMALLRAGSSAEHVSKTVIQLETYSEKLLEEGAKASVRGARKAVRPGSPSRTTIEQFDPLGVSLGQGAIVGLTRGYKSAVAGKQIIAGPVGGTGIESISNAQKIVQADQSILKLKDMQLKHTADRVRAEVELLALQKAYARGEINIVQFKEQERKLASDKKLAAEKELRIQNIINEKKQRIVEADTAQLRAEQEEARNAARRATASMVAPGGIYGPGGYNVFGTVGRTSSTPGPKVPPSTVVTGPGKTIKDSQAQAGMRGMGAMNAMFMVSMAASSLSMLGVTSADASAKLGLFTTALMTATMAAQMFAGKNVVGNFMGMRSLGGKLGSTSAARLAANPALAQRAASIASAGGLAGGRMAGQGAATALAGGGGRLGATLLGASRVLSIAGGPIGIAAGLGITAAITGFMMYKKAADEARERAVAAFNDPVKSAEYFGETIMNVSDILEKNRLSNISEDLQSVDQALRDAVSQDYAPLIEQIKFLSAGAGAQQLSMAYSKMIISGMSAENAKAAVEAIAAEAGVAGGEAFTEAISKGLLDQELTIKEAVDNIVGQFRPGEAKSGSQGLSLLQTINKDIEDTQDRIDEITASAYTPTSPTGGAGQTTYGVGSAKELEDLINKLDQLKDRLEDLTTVNPELIPGVLDSLVMAYQQDPTAAMDGLKDFTDIISELSDGDKAAALNKITDYLQNVYGAEWEYVSDTIDTQEEKILALQMATAGISLDKAINDAGEFDSKLASAVITAKSLADATRLLRISAEEEYFTMIDDFAQQQRDKINLDFENYSNAMDERIDLYEGLKDAAQESFDAEQKARQDSIDGMQDEMDQRRRAFDEEMDRLDDKRDAIEKSSDAYIKSLEKNQRAESFYSQQRKTSFGALEKLSSGDVFGFLQEREQMSQDAQQFSYDEMITGIEERRDLELEAIDEVRKKKQDEQEEYEQMMEDRIQSVQDLMEIEQEAHDDRMKFYDDQIKRADTARQNALDDKNQEIKGIETMEKDYRDNSTRAELTYSEKYSELKSKPYVEARKEMLRLRIEEIYYRGGVTLGQAVTQAGALAFPFRGRSAATGIENVLAELGLRGSPDWVYRSENAGDTGVGDTQTVRDMTVTADTVTINGDTSSSSSGDTDGDGVPDSEDNYPNNPNMFSVGGKVSGPGGPKSDIIPAMLSNGEYVIQASSVNKYGTDLMHSINAGKFAYGGYVSADRAETAAQGNRYGGVPKPQYSGGTPTYSGGYTSANTQATKTSGYKPKVWKQPKIKTGGGFIGDMIFEGLRQDFADFINTTLIPGSNGSLENLIGMNVSGNRFYGQRSEIDKAIGNALFGLNFAPLPFIGAAAKALSSFGKIGASLGSKSSTILNRIPELPTSAFKAGRMHGFRSSQFEKQKQLWMNQSFPRMAVKKELESGKIYGSEYMSAETKAALLKSIPLTSRNPMLFHGSPNPVARFSTPTKYQLEKVQLGPYGIYNSDSLYATSTYARGATNYARPGSTPAVMMTNDPIRPLNLMPYGKKIPSEVLDAIDSRMSKNASLNKFSRQELDVLAKEWDRVGNSGVDRIHFINDLAERYVPEGMTVQDAQMSGLFQSIKNEIGQGILDSGRSSIRHLGGAIMGDRPHSVNILLDVEKYRYNPFYRMPKMEADSLMANGGLVQKFADGGLVEAMEKWFPKGGHQFYPGWNRFTSWAKGKPQLLTMHHTAGNWGQGELDYFAKDWQGVPVVQGFIRRTGTAHTIAGGDTGYGHGEGTTQYMGKNLEQAKELIDLAGHPNRTSWQIEVQSEGKTPDFTSGQFDAIARMTAAVRDWAGWPGFEGRIINHKDWAGHRTDGTARGDTLYPISTFVKNAEKVWEEGGGKPGNNGSNKGGKKPKDPKDPIGPMEAAPFRGLYGALNYLGSENQPKNKPDNNSNDPDNTGGKVTFKNIPDGYTEKDAFRTLDLIKAGGWPTRLHRLAWTIAMRESGGRNIYDTGDYGIFQLNKPSYGDQPWWTSDDKIQNDAVYNSTVAYRHVSSRGSNFLPWAMRVNKDGGYEWDWRYYDPKPSWAGTTEKRTAAFWNSWQYKAGGGMMRLSGGGGAISGPGGPRSDMIPAMLSNGEYVVKASSVAKYGTGFMDQLNAGQLNLGGGGYIPKFANGGMVGPAAMPAFNMPEMASTSVGMTNNNYGGNTSSNSNSTNVKVVINGAGGKSANAIANKVISMINDASSRRNHSRSI